MNRLVPSLGAHKTARVSHSVRARLPLEAVREEAELPWLCQVNTYGAGTKG